MKKQFKFLFYFSIFSSFYSVQNSKVFAQDEFDFDEDEGEETFGNEIDKALDENPNSEQPNSEEDVNIGYDLGNQKPKGTKTNSQKTSKKIPREQLAILRGLYSELGIGPVLPFSPGKLAPGSPLNGDFILGTGSNFHLALGVDFQKNIGIKFVGGGIQLPGESQGPNKEFVRDFSGSYFGGLLTLSLPIKSRSVFGLHIGGGILKEEHLIEKEISNFMLMGQLRYDYYVHVRHFSIGVGANLLKPSNPSRMFLSVTPNLKYTF